MYLTEHVATQPLN